MKRNKLKLAALCALVLSATTASAEGWCDLVPGWQVVTHGGASDNVYILGRLQGGSNDLWIPIASPSVGKSNVALALGAQLGGKNLSIYLDAATATCANFPSWSAVSAVRHIRLID